jgi:hypothetical protein
VPARHISRRRLGELVRTNGFLGIREDRDLCSAIPAIPFSASSLTGDRTRTDIVG